MIRFIWEYGAILLSASFTAICLNYIWDHVELPGRLTMAIMGAIVFAIISLFLMVSNGEGKR